MGGTATAVRPGRAHALAAVGAAALSVADARAPFPLRRLRVDVENTVTDQAVDAPRAEVLRRCLVAAHCVVAVRDGGSCRCWSRRHGRRRPRRVRNLHTFPVLAGADSKRDVVLSSPIIMYDHPGVAPESPGDLFDAGEIDEILSLRTLTLTDEEKREARATDPRAKAIVDRVDALPQEVFARLHGAVRSLRPAADERVRPSPRWTNHGRRGRPEHGAVMSTGCASRGARCGPEPPPPTFLRTAPGGRSTARDDRHCP